MGWDGGRTGTRISTFQHGELEPRNLYPWLVALWDPEFSLYNSVSPTNMSVTIKPARIFDGLLVLA